jgi:nucleoside phosphorylase
MSDLSASQYIEPVDFLIITALQVEREAILNNRRDVKKIQNEGSPTYYIFTLPAYRYNEDYRVAVTMLSQMGNVASSTHASKAINDLRPDYILMVGIAGGIKGKVSLGDVVIASQVLYYEQGKRKLGGIDLRPDSYQVDKELFERAQNYDELTWHELISTPRPQKRDRGVPNAIFGPIAVGEKVETDPNFVNGLKEMHSKLVAIEMESYGVAFAAATAIDRPRFLAIRGISDYADPKKNDLWHNYAAASAAAFTEGFLRSGPVTPKAIQDARVAQAEDKSATIIAVRPQSMNPGVASTPAASPLERVRHRYTDTWKTLLILLAALAIVSLVTLGIRNGVLWALLNGEDKGASSLLVAAEICGENAPWRTLLVEDFSNYTPGQMPSGWIQDGGRGITPTIVEIGGAGPNYRQLGFAARWNEATDEILILNNLRLETPFAITVKLNFQTMYDRAGLVLDWHNLGHYTRVQLDVNNDTLEFWELGPGVDNRDRIGDVIIAPQADYWLCTIANRTGQQQLEVFWSTDGEKFQFLKTFLVDEELSGRVGLATSGRNLPEMHFDNLRVRTP